MAADSKAAAPAGAAAAPAAAAAAAAPKAGAAELQHLAGTAAAKVQGWDSVEINFPYVLEDPECELYALQVLRDDRKKAGAAAAPLRVLTVASGGDVALAIGAAKDVSAVDAIDLNRGQVHACRLKRVAYERLSADACVDFLLRRDPPAADGSAEAEAETKARTAVFEKDIAPHLPADTLAFWTTDDAGRRDQMLRAGLFSFGFRQKEIPALTVKLRAAGLHPYEHAAAARDPANAKAWEDIWRANFLSRLPGQKVGPRIGALVRAALCRGGAHADHWFVRSFFGRPHPNHPPLFLAAAVRGAYPPSAADPKALDTSKVTFEYRELAEALEGAAARGAAYDFVNTSNVLDSIPSPHRARLLTALAQSLAPGGVALFRTGPMDVYDMPDLRALVGQYLTVDTAASDHLKAAEKYLIYSDCVLARKPAKAHAADADAAKAPTNAAAK